MQFSFAAWVNWLGPAEGQSEESAYSQRLFTIHRRTDNWLSVSPRARDTGKVKDGGYLDGLYIDYTFQDNADATHFEQFKPVQGGVSNGCRRTMASCGGGVGRAEDEAVCGRRPLV